MVYLIGDLISSDAGRICGIGIVVLTVFNQVINFSSIEVVFGVKFIPGQSSPVSVGYHHSVPDHHTFKSDFRFPALVGIDQGTGKIRNIHSTIGFSGYPEIIADQLWESGEPSFDGCCVVAGSSAFVVDIGLVLVD